MKVFAKRFWGFDPDTWPMVAFGRDGDRDALIRESDAGDLMAFVGTQHDPTPEDCWGKLIGLGQFSHDIALSRNILAPNVFAESARQTGGTFKWPFAVPVVRAWMFTDRPRPGLVATIGRQFTREANTRGVLLTAEEQERVLSLPCLEVPVQDTAFIRRQRSKLEMLMMGRPTTGPVPASWSKFVTRNADTASFTYVFRFGRTGTWKVGHAVDPVGRLAEVNAHVPHEVLGYAWTEAFRQRHSTYTDAYDMEQRMLRTLGAKRTVGERVQCTEGDMMAAWLKAVTG